MHRHVTLGKCYATCGLVADAAPDFRRGKVPKTWNRFRVSVTGNLHVTSPTDFRVAA
jgi:hypothetical protein